LEALAEGGGICVSRGVHDHLQHRASLIFEDLGDQLVKNIAHPIRAYRLRLGGDSGPVPLGAEAQGVELSADNEVALELALWDSVKDGGSDELAAYLEHYPEGTFASLAHTRGSVAEDTPAEEGQPAVTTPVTPDALDLGFWDAVKDTARPEELAAYLERHPDGHFAALARARLARPEDDTAPSSPEHIVDAIELAFWEGVCDAQEPELLAAYLENTPRDSLRLSQSPACKRCPALP
jgi:adenylate cyclase